MKTIVINQNETWSSLICPNCKYVLDEFHSECNYDGSVCPNCGIDLQKSDYQKEYEKEFEEIEERRNEE